QYNCCRTEQRHCRQRKCRTSIHDVDPSRNYARGKRLVKGIRELIAPQTKCWSAEDKNAAFKIAVLRHAPQAALLLSYALGFAFQWGHVGGLWPRLCRHGSRSRTAAI